MTYQEPFENISVEEYLRDFEQAKKDFILLDVREEDEFRQARIPGAINIPLSSFQARFQEVAQDRPIVVVCARGGRSAMAAEYMAFNGYHNLYNLIDGTLGWLERGLEVESGS
jgi:rhodanese-related sulfurtransferase